MLIVDQLQKDDRRLRVLAIGVLIGMLLLVAGLWRLQVIASRRYTRTEEAQSVRLVRVPAVRGKVLDRHGVPLAENRPSYDVNLYLEELRPSFTHEYTNRIIPEFRRTAGGRKSTYQERLQLQEIARLSVYTNAVQAVSTGLGMPLPVVAERFLRHYRQDLALPLPVVENLNPAQMALFFERCLGIPGIDLEVQAIRTYPYGRLAAHVLGHLRRADEADNDPDPLMFRYRLRDYEGVAGVEGRFDEVLRGRAGVKALRVNSQGYRHEESILEPTEPGRNLRLTLDLDIQWAAENALRRVAGAATRGAAVVMDVRNGDLLALVSSPAFDPNDFLGRFSPEEAARLNDERLRPQMNRAVSGAYPPGSIFKIIVGMAALDARVLEPAEQHEYLGYWPMPGRRIDDLAPPGLYDFQRAFKKSSNAYFIDHGLKAGRERIVSMAQRFGLGERAGMVIGPEARGYLPDAEHLARLREQRDPWTEGDTALLSIGQGALDVTPVQMAAMTAAIANGGWLRQPRLILEVESRENQPDLTPPVLPARDLRLDPRHVAVMQDAMRADVEDSDGTGRNAAVEGFRVCGKTGTAEVKRGRVLVDKITWFVSYAPFESPRYAVVVVIESGSSGGGTSAPVAKQIFEALKKRESGQTPAGRPTAVRPLARGEAQAGEGVGG